ncbi:hypothetical protein EGY05_15390 [Chryseobacterium arthrosphaerae]|uniref:hypothetical protein n=1 Tax=Chryseobacterium arthrosphaerae TaxID=651561 RepID=UPI000F4FB495|nr:hypothetical protein [Chryseobacterium arthrosphaerae]AYZ13234.1 hypothetical protein EGY05_15390 [Chryseobacterium arthrosphaerae]
MSILDDYNISFTNKVIVFNSDQKYNVKIADHHVSDNFWGYFLNHFKSVSDIDEIAGDIDFIQSEGRYDPEYCLEIYLDKLTVRYTDTTARFLDEKDYFIQEISLSDYKAVLLLWKDFLQIPPLDFESL